MSIKTLATASIRFSVIVSTALACCFYSEPLSAQNRDRDQRLRDTGNRIRAPRGTPRFRSPIELSRFRTIDGTFNNAVGWFWGAAGGNIRRMVPNDYADGVSVPAGASRRSARGISNYMCVQHSDIPNNRNLSSMVWQWGQFLDHDLSLTETADPTESMGILIPQGDYHFDRSGVGNLYINFSRSEFRHGLAADVPREQVNQITSWIDASNVYGSDDTTATSLRSFTGGELRNSEGNLLPIGADGFFEAGDIRANEQAGLTAMHTLFMREHNRQARRIAARWPTLIDEQIYVRARQHVGALMQKITYDEFLPALMGENPLAPYTGYNAFAFPNISNEFSTAAYRFGHSMLPTELARANNDGSTIDQGNIGLKDAFFNPANVTTIGIDPYLKGLTIQKAQEIDAKIVNDLRNFLFGAPGAGGFDLAALNIQRGRDHGLADFNSVRAYWGLPRFQSASEISSDSAVQANLELAYKGDVNNVDAWVGILSEDHVAGGSVGPTAKAIFKYQFESLRSADRFWYQRDLSGRDLEEIENTTLADVIERNSGVRNLARNVFFVSE